MILYFLVFMLGFSIGFLGKLLVLNKTWIFWYKCLRWTIKVGRMPTTKEARSIYDEVFYA